MRPSRLRLAFAAVALSGAALTMAGCADSPAAAPTSSSSPAEADETFAPPSGDFDADDVEAAWLDGGRGIAIVTWGSSTCAPVLGDVTAEGQMISVTLAGSDEKACTDDLAPRGVHVGVPEGVDVTQDVELSIEHGQRTAEIDLDALLEAPEGESDQQPSAGWFEDGGIALLTWGSSSCQPVIADLQQTDAGADVAFQELERVCTMDFVPRVTTIVLPEERVDDEPFELTLSGDGITGTVPVIG